MYLPNAAAVQCGIMNPEFKPPSLTKKAGKPLRAEDRNKIKYENACELFCLLFKNKKNMLH